MAISSPLHKKILPQNGQDDRQAQESTILLTQGCCLNIAAGLLTWPSLAASPSHRCICSGLEALSGLTVVAAVLVLHQLPC